MMSVMGLLASNGWAEGSVKYRGEELVGLSPDRLNHYRGSKLTMIFQEPMTSLDPLYRIGDQLALPLTAHGGLSKAAARKRAIELLELVRIPDPARRIDAYPHEMSGGQRQRVMIAMALANNPDVLIADEPTTALDVTVQARILELLADLQKRLGMSIVFITHDLGVVRRFADRTYVMKRGEVVESGTHRRHLRRPEASLHPDADRCRADRPQGAGRRPSAPLVLDAQEHRGHVHAREGLLRQVDPRASCRRRREPAGPRRRDGRRRRRVRLRQVDARPRHPAPAAGLRPRALRGSQPHAPRPGRHAAPAASSAARVPGPVRLPLAAHDGGRDRDRGPARPRAEHLPQGARPPRRPGLRGGAARSGRAQPLPARVLGRPAPAHRHRPRHDPASEARRSRRADLGAGPLGAEGDRRAAARPAEGARPRLCLHQPRPRRRARPLRRDHGHEERQGGGARHGGGDLRSAAARNTPATSSRPPSSPSATRPRRRSSPSLPEAWNRSNPVRIGSLFIA